MVKVVQNSWAGGQLDFELMGRQDFQKYLKGASQIKNFNILKRGGITKRQGFDRILNLEQLGISVGDVNALRLVPFSYSKEHGFVLLFSPGKCHAICTVEGYVYRAFEVVYSGCDESYARPFETEEEIQTFDYQQCGYKLFIASRSRRPSIISATGADIEAALAGESETSPFTWARFIPEVSGGVPTITSFEQKRVAPTADTEGGIVTERYKVSAIFDDLEGDACDEAYNTSIIEPVSISTTSDSTLIGLTYTPGYTTTGKTGSTNSESNVPAITSKTYSNKKAKSCAGTSYYAPWVESQVIKLNISVNPRIVNGGEKWPSEVRIYKKKFGYYGLIGAVKVAQANITAQIAGGAAIGGQSPQKKRNPESSYSGNNSFRYEKVSSDINARQFADETTWKNGDSPTDHGLAKTGWYLLHGDSMVITPKRKIKAATAYLKLHLGTSFRRFTSWSTNYYTRPMAMRCYYVPNNCCKLDVSIAYTYTIPGNNTPVSSTATASVDIDEYASDVTNSYGDYSASSYTTFASTYASQTKVNIAECYEVCGSPKEDLQLNIADIFTFPEGAADVVIENMTITNAGPADPREGGSIINRGDKLVFTGLELYGAQPVVETVTFTDNNITPDTSITPLEESETKLFDAEADFPGVVALAQQRLIWASTKRKPETIWMSAVGDFNQYRQHEVGKTDDAFDFAMPITQFAALNHLIEMKRLIAFNAGCEWVINSNSSQTGLSGETVEARPQSYVGSNHRLKPQVCNNAIVFCERTGQSVRRFSYEIQDDGFAGRDISVLSSSIFENNTIVDWTYQQFPFGMLWCVLADGTMASLTLMDEQDIIAWGTHVHGGDGKVLAVATSRAVSPSLAEIQTSYTAGRAYKLATHEEVFAVVKQDGMLWLERMRIRSKANDTIYNSLCLDSLRVVMDADDYSASGHPDGIMPDATGRIWVLPSDVSLDGSEYSAGDIVERDVAKAMLQGGDLSQIYEGTVFESRMTSVYPIIGNEIGAGQFDVKNILNVGLRLEASYGGTVASARTDATAVPIRYSDDLDNPKEVERVYSAEGVQLLFHDVDCANVKPFGANFRDGRIVIAQAERFPFTLLSMETDYATENEGGGR